MARKHLEIVEVCKTVPEVRVYRDKYTLELGAEDALDLAIKRSKCGWVDPRITELRYPGGAEQAGCMQVELVRFSRLMRTPWIHAEIAALGLRPSGLRQLLALSQQSRRFQSEYPVLAFGSQRSYRANLQLVPALWSLPSLRLVTLNRIPPYKWLPGTIFIAEAA